MAIYFTLYYNLNTRSTVLPKDVLENSQVTALEFKMDTKFENFYSGKYKLVNSLFNENWYTVHCRTSAYLIKIGSKSERDFCNHRVG